MKRVNVALFLSFLVACAPATTPQKTFVDSYYEGSVNGQASPYNGRGWVYKTPAYVLRYWLGTHEEGSAPGSVKLELSAKAPVVIDWNDSLYVYADGTTSPVLHEGVPYGYRPADTRLEAQSVWADRVVPTRNLVSSGGRVSNAFYLVDPDDFGASTIGLRLVVNAQPLEIRFSGARD